ncbi:MAG: hypothetical protein Q9218_001245 [Villophora microphyllina]
MPADYNSTAQALALPVSPPDSPTLTHQHTRWNRQSGRNSLTRNRSSFAQPESSLSSRVFRKIARFGRDTQRRLTPVQLALASIAGFVAIILTILFFIFNDRFFGWLEPRAVKWKNLKGGWCILWAMTFMTAFPPVIGYSTCFTLAGFVYGLSEGWLIIATATVAGSTCSFITSRTIFSGFVQRLVANDKRFQAFSSVLKHDGLKLLIMIRLCPLPYSLSNGAISTFPTVTPQVFALATAAATLKLFIPIFIGTRTKTRAKQLETEERSGLQQTQSRSTDYSDDPDEYTATATVPRDDQIDFRDDNNAHVYRNEYNDDEDNVSKYGDGDEEETIGLDKHPPREGIGSIDSAEYDPIDHLNFIFAHPSTLSSIDKTSRALDKYLDELDKDIAALVRQQSISDAESVKSTWAAKKDLAELFPKVEDVRARAMQTEETITEMTADIKRLDNTKRNLTLSMTALKRLQMLTTAYEQLRGQSTSRQYKECAQLLQAVIQLMAHFKSYRSIDQIAALSRNVSDLQRELLEQICEDFEVTFAKSEITQRRGMLAEACLVMDALGDNARSRLITWYCNTQLREYRQVFRGNEEAGSLDNISRRYAWFRRMLKTYDDEHAVMFPANWRMNEMLANAFCEGTREDFKGILSRSVRRPDGESLDVELLLSCLQETLEFEHSLERRFNNAVCRFLNLAGSSI